MGVELRPEGVTPKLPFYMIGKMINRPNFGYPLKN